MALPAKYDLTVYAGDDFDFDFRLRSGTEYEDLTGKVGFAEVRDQAGPDGELLGTFTVTFPAAGTVHLHMPSAQTAALKAGVYDVQLQNADGSGKRTRLAGKVKVVAQVTR